MDKYINHRIDKHFHSWLINGLPIESIVYILTKMIERRNL